MTRRIFIIKVNNMVVFSPNAKKASALQVTSIKSASTALPKNAASRSPTTPRPRKAASSSQHGWKAQATRPTLIKKWNAPPLSRLNINPFKNFSEAPWQWVLFLLCANFCDVRKVKKNFKKYGNYSLHIFLNAIHKVEECDMTSISSEKQK